MQYPIFYFYPSCRSSSIIVDGPLELPNGSLCVDNPLSIEPKAIAEISSSTSDAVLVPKCDSWAAAVGSNNKSAEIRTLVPAARGLDAMKSVSNNQHELPAVGSHQESSSASEKQPVEPVEVAQLKIAVECPVAEKSHVSDAVADAKSSSSQGIDQLRVTCCLSSLYKDEIVCFFLCWSAAF